jgi:hypothetical protein
MVSCVVTVCFIFGILTVGAFGAGTGAPHFTDVDPGSQAGKIIEKWSDAGILLGSQGKFRPKDPITRAEFAIILQRIMKYPVDSSIRFSDVKESDGFYKDILAVAGAGVMQGAYGKAYPRDNISRQEAMVMLSRAFGINSSDGVSAFKDAGEIASYAKAYVAAMTVKGYIKGNAENKFKPKDNLTRVEAVTILDRIIPTLVQTAGTAVVSEMGNVLVNCADVTLSNAKINGDLYIAPGVGDGSFYAKKVSVTGKVIVQGGGIKSVYLEDTTVGSIVVDKKGGEIRVVAQGSTSIPSAQLLSGARLETSGTGGATFGQVNIAPNAASGQPVSFTGSFGSVVVGAPGVPVEIMGGTIGSMTVAQSAAGASIAVTGGALVTNLTLNAAANVTGQGRIGTATINANNVVISQKPGTTVVDKNVTQGSVGGQSVTTATTTPPASSGTGSGGSGNSDSNNNGNNGGDSGNTESQISASFFGTWSEARDNTEVQQEVRDYVKMVRDGNLLLTGFTIKPSIFPVGDKINTSVMDKNRVLWIGTDNGLVRIDQSASREQDKILYFSGATYLLQDKVVMLIDDGDGGVWALTGDNSVSGNDNSGVSHIIVK